MNLGTKIYTWMYGKYVGEDEFGNRYYCNSKNFEDHLSKRWVIFKDEIEASSIPPHWHAWLHKTVNIPPINYSKKYLWQKEIESNLTGTSKAYSPNPRYLNKLKDSKKNNIEYEKWKP